MWAACRTMAPRGETSRFTETPVYWRTIAGAQSLSKIAAFFSGAGIGHAYYGFAKNVFTAAKQNGATRIV